MEFKETWHETRYQRPLPSLCFSGWSEKQDGLPGLWLAETFFDFSSETTERNSMKMDRKQDLDVLYQVCVFRADQKNKTAILASDWLRHFLLFLRNHWTEFKETWLKASLCFSVWSVHKNGWAGCSVKKVAHCTRVHNMWPFGPLFITLFSDLTIWDIFTRVHFWQLYIFHTINLTLEILAGTLFLHLCCLANLQENKVLGNIKCFTAWPNKILIKQWKRTIWI